VFGKKRLFALMRGYVDVLYFSMCEAALRRNLKLKTPEGRRQIVGAMNILFGRTDPTFTENELRSARNLAARLLKAEVDIRTSSVQALRTLLVTDGPDLSKIETIDWIATFGNLPPGPVNPDNLSALAAEMGLKYGMLKSQ
jgi:hypothetical protein